MEFNSKEELDEYLKKHPIEALNSLDKKEIDIYCSDCDYTFNVKLPIQDDKIICPTCNNEVNIILDID